MERKLVVFLLALALAGTEVPSLRAGSEFVRGDVNGDATIQIGDAVAVLWYLFRAGTDVTCLDAADADDDGRVQVNDAIFVINSLIRGGPPPPPPFPLCGEDRTDDDLGCESSSCDAHVSLYGGEITGNAFFFVVDRSGSMQDSGELQRATGEISRVLGELPAGSEFGIVFFDASVIKFPASSIPARVPELLANARAWLAAIAGGAGSCVGQGLMAALDFAEAATVSPRVIVYIGDGGGTCRGQREETYLQETLAAVTARNGGRARIHTVGVLMAGRGQRHREFLRQLAELNGGTYTEVN